MSVGLYSVFLAMQTVRHREYFVAPSPAMPEKDHKKVDPHEGHEFQSVSYPSLLLLAYVFPIVLLAKQIAVPID